jgi:hypothetical protein
MVEVTMQPEYHQQEVHASTIWNILQLLRAVMPASIILVTGL